MYKTLELTLDTEKTNNTKTNAQNFLVNTNDYESIKIIADIVQDKERVDLSDATVKLAIRKPDKTIVFQDGTVTAAVEGECEFVLETQSYVLRGTHVAEVMIYFADGKIVVTRAFAYHVAEGILTDTAIESTSWYQDVNELQLAVQELQVEVDAFIDTAVAETRAEITEVDQRLTSQLADKATKGQIVSDDLSVATDAGKIKLVNLADEVQQALTGNAPALSVIADKSVTVEKVGFLDLYDQNLYNDATKNVGYTVSSVSGTLLANASYSVSDYIAVTPGEQYYIDMNATLTIAFYDENNVFVSGLAANWDSSNPTELKKVLTVPTNQSVKKMRFTLANSYTNVMVVKGTTKPIEYIPYGTYKVEVSDAALTDTIKQLATERIEAGDYMFKKQSINIDALEQYDVRKINLADPAEFIDNSAISATTGSVTTLSNYQASGFIPIVGGAAYRISQTNNYAWYDVNKVFISGVSGGWSQAVLTAPANAAFIRVTFSMANSNKMVVQGDLLPSSYIVYDSFDNIEVFFTSDQWRTKIQNALGVTNRLGNLDWNALGDSITFGTGASSYPYHTWIAERTGINVTNYGIPTSTVSDMSHKADPSVYNPMVLRYMDMTDDADIITVMGGTNDIIHGAPLGVFGDTGTHTFYGALDTLLSGLINKYPTKSIGYILPPFPKNGTDYARSETINFINAIKQVCQRYTIPVLDLYTTNQLSGIVPARASILVPDGLHPSKEGHEKLSFSIEQFLLSI